ncbi:glypican-5-like [Diadema antillarum]|uniref:glypican-5-like n=1 Tax=Diadema antillarum TaxID=105358 RepID=UPI003A893A3E
MDRLGLIMATILTLFSTRPNAARGNTLTTCTNVYSELSLLQFRYYTEIPLNPVNAQDLRVCRTGMSCCTRALERELVHQAKHDFQISLQTSTTYLKYTLASSAVDFRTEFEELLQYGKERIQQHFRQSYTRIAVQMNSPIEDLFGTVLDYLHGMEVDIEATVARFFNTLFPHIYTSHINPTVTRLNPAYRDCLSNRASVIMPFGYAHRELSQVLEKSLTVARMFLSAVNLGLEVMNSTVNMAVTGKCERALMKMRYCGQCQSLVGVPACQGYCFNVIKGCLANFMDLDLYWREYVARVVDLVRVGMTAEYDLQQTMFSLNERVKAAIDRAVEDKDYIIQATLRTCGPPPISRPSPYNDFAINNPAMDVPIAPNPSIPLDERLLQFLENLDTSKSVFRDLPVLMCSQGNMAKDSNNDCWTGETSGSYLRQVVDDGLAAQLFNPEVKLTSRERELLDALRLMDKLEHMTQKMEKFLTHYLVSKNPNFGDDEWSGDGFSGSGSGSGDYSGSGDDTETTPLPHFTLTTAAGQDPDFSFEPTPKTSRTKSPHEPTEKIPYRPITEDPSGQEETPKPAVRAGAAPTHTVTSLAITVLSLCASLLVYW